MACSKFRALVKTANCFCSISELLHTNRECTTTRGAAKPHWSAAFAAVRESRAVGKSVIAALSGCKTYAPQRVELEDESSYLSHAEIDPGAVWARDYRVQVQCRGFDRCLLGNSIGLFLFCQGQQRRQRRIHRRFVCFFG